MSEKMKVVMVKPMEEAEITEIDNSLESFQNIVEGCIEAYYPFYDDVCILCNDEGKYNGMSPNRAVYSSTGELEDVVFGPFFICGTGECDFNSLTDEQAEHYRDLFYKPEMFYMECGALKVCKL